MTNASRARLTRIALHRIFGPHRESLRYRLRIARALWIWRRRIFAAEQLGYLPDPWDRVVVAGMLASMTRAFRAGLDIRPRREQARRHNADIDRRRAEMRAEIDKLQAAASAIRRRTSEA